MSSLLTSSEIAAFTDSFINHFETFASFSNLTVHKEPLKTLVLNTGEYLPGYGDQSNETNYLLTPVSGVYRAMKINERNTDEKRLTELQTRFPGNKIRVKVERNCYDFIQNGKNEQFEIDGLIYDSLENVYVQNYLGAKYYILELKTVI